MLADLEHNFSLIVGGVAVVLPVLGWFSPLKRFRFGHHTVFNLFAFIISVAFVLFAFRYRQLLHKYPSFVVWLLFGGGLLLLSFFIAKRYGAKKPNHAIFMCCVLYAMGVGVVAFGFALLTILSSYFEVSGQVVLYQQGERRPLVDTPVYLMSDTDGISFKSETDSSGNYSFLVTSDDVLHAARIDVCHVDSPQAFRVLTFDKSAVDANQDKKIVVNPPIRVSKDEKCTG